MARVLASSEGEVRKQIACQTAPGTQNGNQIASSVPAIWFSRPHDLLTDTQRVDQLVR